MAETGKRRIRVRPTNILGWLVGGLSLLNLIEDLTPLTLFGKLKKWIHAYVAVVDQISDILFGWVHYRWVSISALETHALVVASVLIAAYFRAEFRNCRASAIMGHI